MRVLLAIAVVLGASGARAGELPSDFQGNWGASDQECREHPLTVISSPAAEMSDNFGHEQAIVSVRTRHETDSMSNSSSLLTIRGPTTKDFYTYREIWAIRQMRGHVFLIQTYLGEVPPRRDDAPTISILQRCVE